MKHSTLLVSFQYAVYILHRMYISDHQKKTTGQRAAKNISAAEFFIENLENACIFDFSSTCIHYKLSIETPDEILVTKPLP